MTEPVQHYNFFDVARYKLRAFLKYDASGTHVFWAPELILKVKAHHRMKILVDPIGHVGIVILTAC